MTKAQAANFLGISPRTLDNYVSKGLLKPTTVPGKTKPLLDFDESALIAFSLDNDPVPTSTALALPEPMALVGTLRGGVSDDAIHELARVLSEMKSGPATIVSLDKKLLLTLEQASEFSELPQGRIREALVSGALYGKKIGRSWRVKPYDLELYVAQLMSED